MITSLAPSPRAPHTRTHAAPSPTLGGAALLIFRRACRVVVGVRRVLVALPGARFFEILAMFIAWLCGAALFFAMWLWLFLEVVSDDRYWN